MSMEKNLNNFLEELIQEVENELDEATTSGAAGAYNTPNAFSDKGAKDKKLKKKIATQLGMKLVGKIDESVITERQFKGLDGIDDKTPLSKISDKQKLKIIQGTGNIISFKVPKGSDRNFWQVISKGKIKKTRNPQGYTRYILPGKMISSPFFKSEKDLVNGVDWDSVEKARRFNESLNESIRVGKVISIKKYNPKTNSKESVDVKITNYIKKSGSKDFVEYELKGKKGRVSIDVFKSIMELVK